MQGLGWTEAEVERAFDGCYDLHLLQDPHEPRMHQLFAAFIRETRLGREEQAALARVSTVQMKRFLELAGRISANPADLNHVTLLLDYPLSPGIWSEMRGSFSVEEGELVGRALCEVGRFEEARPWFERAVPEAEKGDVHGRMDHASLGISLHEVGYCYSRTGRFEEARPWFERALTEKAQGDVNGRVDHDSLGRSVHEVGYCYSRTGRFEEALPWFERAVAEAEMGDLHGRVEKETVSALIQSLVNCLRELGRSEDARQWEQRYALAARASAGDVSST
jgi:tetratricopeptide (TPR) repeat protein